MRNVTTAICVVLAATCLLGAACSRSDVGGGAGGARVSSVPATSAPAPSVITVDEAVGLDRPIVLAHAGGENAHPHSTPYAYERSVVEGVDVLDFDVRLTADGVLVVFHDDTVDRTTNGTGRVDQMTYGELEQLDAAYWFTESCSACTGRAEKEYALRGVRTGEVAPPDGSTAEDFAPARFEDLVERYPDHVLNIEMKGDAVGSVPVASELARILTEHDKLDSSIVTAFDDGLAEAFHRLAPEVEITPGVDAMTQYVLADVAPVDGRRILQIPPEYSGVEVLTPELVARAHAAGFVLWIWPNERGWENTEGYGRLLGMGVDGINAADPAAAVAASRAAG